MRTNIPVHKIPHFITEGSTGSTCGVDDACCQVGSTGRCRLFEQPLTVDKLTWRVVTVSHHWSSSLTRLLRVATDIGRFTRLLKL